MWATWGNLMYVPQVDLELTNLITLLYVLTGSGTEAGGNYNTPRDRAERMCIKERCACQEVLFDDPEHVGE